MEKRGFKFLLIGLLVIVGIVALLDGFYATLWPKILIFLLLAVIFGLVLNREPNNIIKNLRGENKKKLFDIFFKSLTVLLVSGLGIYAVFLFLDGVIDLAAFSLLCAVILSVFGYCEIHNNAVGSK